MQSEVFQFFIYFYVTFYYLENLLSCAMLRIAGHEAVYQTIPVRTITFCTGIEYCRGKTATFPLPNDDLSKDQELLKSWSYERSKKKNWHYFSNFSFKIWIGARTNSEVSTRF